MYVLYVSFASNEVANKNEFELNLNLNLLYQVAELWPLGITFNFNVDNSGHVPLLNVRLFAES